MSKKRKIESVDVGDGPDLDLVQTDTPPASVPSMVEPQAPVDIGLGDGPVAMGDPVSDQPLPPSAPTNDDAPPPGSVDIREAVISGSGAEAMPILEGVKKSKKNGDAITPEARAMIAATVGKVMFDGVLEWGAARLGSSMTPEGHMRAAHEAMSREAIANHQPPPPMGLPIDLNFHALIRGDLANAVVREISIVLTVKNGVPTPVRYAMGVTTLRENEPAAASLDDPREGEFVVVVIPATIGMTVAAQFASTGDDAAEKAGKWLQSHEEQIRMAAGALLAGGYAWAVVQDVRGSK